MRRGLLILSSIIVAFLLIAFGGAIFRLAASGTFDRDQRSSGLGSTFTYQGYLTDNDAPANGSYDFVFTLYTAANGGSQVGPAVTVEDQAVSGGLFTVELDFEPGAGVVFDGTALWLQISVRPGPDNGKPYKSLTPRQALTAAPYAVYASRALWGGLLDVPAGFADGTDDDTLADISCAAGEIVEWDGSSWICGLDDLGSGGGGGDITGVTAGYGLGGGGEQGTVTLYVMTGTIQSRVNGNCPAGSALQQINQDGTVTCEIDDDTLSSLSCSNGQIARWSGNAWICADPGSGGDGWSLTGNSGTTAGTNFLGTTDAEPLELRVDGARALRLEPDAISPNFIAGYGGNSAGANAVGATVGGGGRDLAINQASGNYSTVDGGAGNTAGGYASAVGGGEGNNATGDYAIANGGGANNATGDYATISGGQNNTTVATNATIAGGNSNAVNQPFGTVSGGASNAADANFAVVGGGSYNNVAGKYGTIAGGGPSDLGNPTTSNNRVWDDYGTVSGGGNNIAGNDDGNSTNALGATVGGGQSNAASASYASVSGGSSNTAGAYGAAVGGGVANSASANYATVAGGSGNSAGSRASVGGGQGNNASGAFSTIGGGTGNDTTANYGTIPGGVQNYVGGNYGFAAGYQARAEHQGSFVWSDSTGGNFASTGVDQFLIQASGGVGIGTNHATPTATLSVGGNMTIIGEGRLVARGVVTGTNELYVKGLQKPSAVDAIGNYIYVTGSATNTLTIVDVSDPDYPKPITYTTASMNGPLDVQVEGGLAFIASELNDKLVILDVSDPGQKPRAIGSSDPRHMAKPQAVYVSGNHVYVASNGEDSTGDRAGLFIFDVSDPTVPLYINSTDTNLDGPTDVYVARDHAYATSWNNDSLAIFDISNPSNILAKGVFSDPNLLDGPKAVQIRGSYAYVLAENAGRLVILDIRDPYQITLAGSISTSLSHPRSLFLSGDYVYVTYAGEPATANQSGLAVFDVSRPSTIQLLAEYDMSDSVPEPEKPVAIAGNGRHIYVVNENHWSVAIYDINHITAPAVAAGTLQADHLEALGNAQVDHNLSIGDGLNVGSGGALIEGQLAVAGQGNNYILGNLSLGAAGYIDEAEDIQQIYPTQQLDIHGDARFRINDEHSLMFASPPEKGAFFDFTTNNFGSYYTPTARIEFSVPDPFTGTTHTTEVKILTQSASDSEVRGRLTIGEETSFYNVGPDLELRTTITLTKNGDVLPGVDNTYKLGDNDHRWQAVYAANGTLQTSDGRWKENVTNLRYGLNEVEQLRPVSFNWIDHPTDGQHYGLIAQEVAEILPEVVNGGESGEPLGMNYGELVPVLVNAIQEQQQQIDGQEAQIADLEARLSVLEASRAGPSLSSHWWINASGLFTITLAIGLLALGGQRRRTGGRS